MPDQIIKEVVCTGRCTLKGGSQGLSFLVLDEEGQKTDRELAYKAHGKGILSHAKAGFVYSLDFKTFTDEDCSVLINSLKYLRPWQVDSELMQWQEADRSWSLLARAKRKEKVDTGRREALEAMLPLRRLYSKTDYLGKLALEVQVLAYLRAGLVLSESGGDE